MFGLGKLPASNSPQFSMNALDWAKIRRMVLVQIAGLLVGFVPMLTGFRYVYKGVDYTPVVVMTINTFAEALRRFVSK